MWDKMALIAWNISASCGFRTTACNQIFCWYILSVSGETAWRKTESIATWSTPNSRQMWWQLPNYSEYDTMRVFLCMLPRANNYLISVREQVCRKTSHVNDLLTMPVSIPRDVSTAPLSWIAHCLVQKRRRIRKNTSINNVSKQVCCVMILQFCTLDPVAGTSN